MENGTANAAASNLVERVVVGASVVAGGSEVVAAPEVAGAATVVGVSSSRVVVVLPVHAVMIRSVAARPVYLTQPPFCGPLCSALFRGCDAGSRITSLAD
jgi:hypothetical protein